MLAEDEAIISLNHTNRKLWAPKGSKPIQPVTGSHKNVYSFGAVSDEINQCRIAIWINEDSFIWFAKYLLRLHEKVVLIVDRATHHIKSNKVKMLVKKHKDNLIIWSLPKRLPEVSANVHHVSEFQSLF